jgi:hypothetical protein
LRISISIFLQLAMLSTWLPLPRSPQGCTSATLKVLNDIITAIDKRQYCAAVFINLAKAFDSVNHHILIGRLNSLGFSNDCLA